MSERSKIKIIAFDLDGTILNDQGKLSNYTKNIISKLPVLKIIISARALDNIQEISHQLNSSGIIYSNGAGIVLDNKTLTVDYISQTNYQKLIKMLFNNYPEISIKVKGDQNIFINFENQHEVINNIEKITIKLSNYDKIISLIKKLKVFNVDVVNQEFIIVTSKQTSKYLALKKIINTKNLNLNEIIYFGNDLNDLELFKKIPLSVAVDNASSKVINEATYLCQSNNLDGVAKFLTSYFHKKVENKTSNFNGGSVADVTYDKINRCIQKSVSINNEGINNGYSKLFYEAKHMQQYNLLNKHKFYPDIYEIKERNHHLIIKMEYLYQGLTLTDLLLNNQIGNKFINKSLNNILDTLFERLYLNQKNIFPHQEYLNINYFDRVASRIDKVLKILRKNTHYPRIKSALQDGIYLNNKYYPSILEYNNYLRKDKYANEILTPKTCTDSHQDLIPSNILVDYNGYQSEITNFKLIDPRGEGDTGLDTRHFTYDLGKLLFGLHGFELFRRSTLKHNYSLTYDKIDNLYHYQFTVFQNQLTNKLLSARTHVLKQLEEHKYQYFDSIDLINTYKEKILLAEAYCFFADLPCRLINGDDEEILLCFYLRGIECLTEVMKLIYGKDMIADDN